MAKYTATSEVLGKALSEFVPFELNPTYTRDVFTASGAVALGDVITMTVGEATVYGIAAAAAVNAQEVPAIVRGAVINSAAVSLSAAQKAAFIAQGCKVL